MKVLIVNSMQPFVWGGAEELAANLQKNLILAGHQAEVLRIPFQWEPASRIPSQMLMVRSLELPNVDHVIALKFPAYLIRHPRKTLWLLHQYRQAYDLYDAGQTNLPPGDAGSQLQSLIRNADNRAFTESRNIFTNSPVTQRRLEKYNGMPAQVLPPPVNDPELFHSEGPGGYIFAGGRVNSMKRQYLLVEALAHANKNVKLLIAGPPDNDDEANRVVETVERLGLRDRVQLDLRFLPRDVYAKYINNATAVAYLPFDEDSLGYVAMEAATAGKALITTTDSGGVLGLVKDGETGWVAEPDSKDLARVLSAPFANPQRTANYGSTASTLWREMKITWPDTIEALIQ